MPQLVIRFYSIQSARMLRLGLVVVTCGAVVALLPYLNGALARVLLPLGAITSPDQAPDFFKVLADGGEVTIKLKRRRRTRQIKLKIE